MVDGDELIEISGNTCKRGVAFAKEELTAPRRMLTTTVQVRNGEWPLVPVRTLEPLPKGLLLTVAQDLRAVILDAPVAARQVVLGNVRGTGVDIVTSRAMPAAEPAATRS